VRASASETGSQEHAAALRLRYLVPIIVFVALVLTLSWALKRDPQTIPSALIGGPVPEFALPPVKGRTLGLSTADLTGEVSLVNVFASWCVECRAEHPLLLQVKADAIVPIHGLNYKDLLMTRQGGSIHLAIPTRAREPISTAASASIGASMASPRPL